ncbi:sensor histidine kinase [Nonomuraea soli]|uniref:histidine kinase n=1 Tax=Nonomuraea soli TaxID=1032476 RepID=A0A7W0CLS9_9ACTN|nr:nitrate- and nitrite sensing domain-containing protein [Nonomuraea soli]MBA2893556.1 signal transduction histidine kinase [Nonomuraea soli]
MLLVPIVSMLVLWGVLSAVSAHESLELRAYQTLWSNLRHPAYRLGAELQRERLAAVRLLRTGQPAARQAFLLQHSATDEARERFLTRSAESRSAYAAEVDEVLIQVARLDVLRGEVSERLIGRYAAVESYSDMVDALFGLHRSVALINDIPIYEQSRLVINLGFAKELLTREQAIGAGPTSEQERTAFTQIVGNRRFLIDQSLAELDPELRDIQVGIIASPEYLRLRVMEEQIIDGRVPVDWPVVSKELVEAFGEAEMHASSLLAGRAVPVADAVMMRAFLLGGIGAVLVMLSIFISLRQASRLSKELAELRRAALEVAEERLPQVVARLREGAEVEAPAITVRSTTTEIKDVGTAFATVQSTAVEAAVGQAQLREGVRQVFRNLSRRSQALLHRQRIQLESMQHRATEPGTLDDLFRLDHLTTRMRRHAESLIILSGATPGRGWSKPVRLLDVVRGATAEVEDYPRVNVEEMPGLCLDGAVVADTIHLIAELIENATVFSPPTAPVTVRGENAAHGFAVVVEDRGLGMGEAELAHHNALLAAPPEFDALHDGDQLGLFVVGRLAARHDIRVTLRGSPYGGTTAIVLIPAAHVIIPVPTEVEVVVHE